MTHSKTVWELGKITAEGGRAVCVDVRSVSEFAAGHIPGAINIPMDEIETRLCDLPTGSPLVLVCQRGQRAQLSARLLEPYGLQVSVLDGGTAAWIHEGLPIVRSGRTRWSLERQIRLGAGLFVLLGALLGIFLHPAWVALAIIAGSGLVFAGLTDVCLRGMLLGRMPWNSPCGGHRPGPARLRFRRSVESAGGEK